MLESARIQRRQSEVREQLSALAANESLSEEQRREIDALDKEYRSNEARYRAALIAEDTERREAGKDLETREDREYSELVRNFQVSQVAGFYAENRNLEGATAEIVEEMRSKRSYAGIPVPLEALETRAGETVAAGTPDPISTRPITDRLFADSVAGRMGFQTLSIAAGEAEWPVVTSSVSAGWADGELADVGGPAVFATTDKALKPNNNFGVQMEISRRAMKQSGAALEQAVRRDMGEAIRVGLDRAAFLGTGANGQPLGVIAGAGTYGITSTAFDAEASFAAFSAAVARFLTANAASSAGAVRLLLRPELWNILVDKVYTGTASSEWDRLVALLGSGNITTTSNALAAPAGDPAASSALMATNAGGVPPAAIGIWGGVDVIRDPYTLAGSGQLKLSALVTVDVTVIRPAQLEIVTGLQAPSAP